MVREAEILVSKKAKPVYGDIALLYNASAKTPPSHLPISKGEDIPSAFSDCIAPPVPEESTAAYHWHILT